MTEFIQFLAAIAAPLVDLFKYAQKGQQDLSEEHRISLALIRSAVDAQAKKEITG